ncbi:SDR family oxidoreductase [Caulobacter segnis]|uniref:Short-chain dehydrogenase/reductase SDR n=2 Tax=Caulobacter segnis TaxID=88688 RepID=D5VMV7_CAUST|nr:SDR family oxidoreductase [Caulobacter segnis]ADG11830.1 short-chain dehydrogenase/reductase SDR [Caulobacter segnis ATCC 21756]AVQ03463.1 SDR family oxidoreductase [Caulobacter segnis]
MSDSNTQGVPGGAALITGASTGIGATYADRLAKRGQDLILVARDEARLNALAERLRAETGVKVEVIKADLTNKADLLKLEERLASDPAISTLINNAGVAGAGDFVGSDPDAFEKMIQLNVTAVTRLAAAAARNFVPRNAGTIINLASVVGLMPELNMPVDGATKAFVTYLTQGLRVQFADSAVRLQAVLPGATRTEIWERSGSDVDALDPNMVMGVDDMVNAALAGFDQGELVTIPSLPDAADWNNALAAKAKLYPNLSRSQPADRFKA